MIKDSQNFFEIDFHINIYKSIIKLDQIYSISITYIIK